MSRLNVEFPKVSRRSYFLSLDQARRIVMDRLEEHYIQVHDVELRGVWVLMCANEKPSSQALMAECLGINNNVMVRLIDRLEKSNLIRRLQNQDDRREHVLHLTDKGQRHLKTIYDNFDNVALKVFSPLTLDILRRVKKELDVIIENA